MKRRFNTLRCFNTPFNAMDYLKEDVKLRVKSIGDIKGLVDLFHCTDIDPYIAQFEEVEVDIFKVLCLNIGGVEANAFEERFFSSTGRVWNNGTFSMKPMKFEMKTIVGKEDKFIEKVTLNASTSCYFFRFSTNKML